MKFTWGHALILTFLAFAGFMGYLAYRSFNTNYDLVSKEYYKDELAYQNIIDGTNRADSLSEKVTLKQQGKDILLTLPAEMKSTSITGNILFYCPADARRDRKVDININNDTKQLIKGINLIPGVYTAKISWNAYGKFYYSEQTFLIQ
jgi:hypothetical protein